MLKTPIAIVNFKTYQESLGANAVKLAKLVEKTAKKEKKSVAVAVSACDLPIVARKVKIPVLCQHADPVEFGSHTGSILLENIKERGGAGTLINHSEKRVPHEIIEQVVKKSKLLGLTAVVCSKDENESKELARFNPEFLAVEPPELIGSGISVSKARPEVVINSVKNVKEVSKDTHVLCGAGISGTEDVKKALELGADGVLLASFITKAKEQKKAVKEILDGI